MECLGDLFGPERAEELTKQKPSEEEIKKMTPCMKADKTKPKPKKNEKGPRVFGPQQIQCLIDIFGSEKADRLTKEKPSEEDMKKMAPCMEPGKTKPKNEKGPTVYSPNQMKCLNNVFGPKKAESIRLGGMANVSPEDTKKMEPCMEQ